MRNWQLLAANLVLALSGCGGRGDATSTPVNTPQTAADEPSAISPSAEARPALPAASMPATRAEHKTEPAPATSHVRSLITQYLQSDGQGGWRKNEKAATALEQLGPDDVRRAWELLHDSDASVRRGAAVYLLPLMDPASSEQVAALTGLLRDSDSMVRARGIDAARQFSQVDQLRALPELTALLDPGRENRVENRAAAARLIGSLKQAAVEALASVLNAAETDPNSKVRSAALAAATAISSSLPVIQTLGKSLSDPDEAVRLAAASRLRQLGAVSAPVATELAAGLADSNADVAEAAAEALIRLGPQAVQPLSRQLASRPPQAKKLALAALIKIGPPAKPAAEEIQKCLADPDPQVKQLAETALKRLAAP